jgi:hypothetical protein
MPKDYFQLIPLLTYDVDGDGTEKAAVDILRRVKTRTATLLDGAIFYNYPMQDGDTAEIIADKYYGSAKYHWIVLLMNNILDHTYDFTLNDFNFESYIKEKYGSLERSQGVTQTLDGATAEIAPEWWNYQKRFGAGTGTTYYDSTLRSGTIPAGHSTGIRIKGSKGASPWSSNIDVGDVIRIFVPEDWYDKTVTSTHDGTLEENTATDRVILQANTATTLAGLYLGGTITITGEGTGTTGITGNTRIISTYDPSTKEAVLTEAFLHLPQGGLTADAWTYSLSFDAPANYSKVPYTFSAKIIAKSERIDPDATDSHSHFYFSTEMNSNTYLPFTWDSNETISIKTGINHFELDAYDSSGTTQLAENVWISQDQYVNTSVGTISTKKIVSNYDYEAEQNENKRIIYLLRKEYLNEFIDEFESLINIGE